MPGLHHAMLANCRAHLAEIDRQIRIGEEELALARTKRAHCVQRIAELEAQLRFELAPVGMVQDVDETG